MEIEDPLNDQTKLLLLNVTDWGSHYQQVVQLQSKHASTVWKGFCEVWIRILGPPTMVVCDQGTEFQQDFGAAVSAHGSLLVTVNTRTPWEAGKTEKAGGMWKDLFRLVVEQERPVDGEEAQTLISLPQGQRGAWQGPGIVTMVTDRSLWVTVRHALWKVPPEHVRPATSQESLGIEVLNKCMSSMQQELARRDSRRGPRRYIDAMGELEPLDEDIVSDLSLALPLQESQNEEGQLTAEANEEGRMTEEANEGGRMSDGVSNARGSSEGNGVEDSTPRTTTEEATQERERAEATFRVEAAIIRQVLQQAPPPLQDTQQTERPTSNAELLDSSARQRERERADKMSR
eukprot:6478282-Amphidinium_carterae.3